MPVVCYDMSGDMKQIKTNRESKRDSEMERCVNRLYIDHPLESETVSESYSPQDLMDLYRNGTPKLQDQGT